MESVSSRTRGKQQRASKHKIPCDVAETVTRRKKALLNGDDNKLKEAINNGDLKAVTEILGKADRKVTTSCWEDEFLKAVEAGNKQIVRLLLSGDAPFKVNKFGRLALIAAIKQGNSDVVKTLIRKSALVDKKDSFGKTALMTAIENNSSSSVITAILDQGKANVNLQDNDGKTALMLAVERWDYDTVQILLSGNEEETKNYECDEHIKDKNGHTALDIAKMNGSERFMQVLSQSCKESCSPLTLAIEWKDVDLMRRLVEINPLCLERPRYSDQPLNSAMQGFDSDLKTWDGKIHCDYELIEFLVKAGANINGCHMCGLTPLMFAAIAGSVKIVELLLFHRVDVDERSEEYDGTSDELSDISENKHKHFRRRTALMMAAEKGWVKVVDMLLQAGAMTYKKDIDGETAFSLAVKGNHRVCVKALMLKQELLSAADIELITEHRMLDILPEVKDKWDTLLKDSSVLQNVLFKAVKASFYELVRSLIKHLNPPKLPLNDEDVLAQLVKMGADINSKSEQGHTALMGAASNGNKAHVANILKCNADMYAEHDGNTALSLASVRDQREIVKALLDKGFDINHVSGNRTALWCCLFSEKHDSAEMLINHGANVNFAGLHGITILMLAVLQSPLSLTELIIKSVVDINAQDCQGNTALLHAMQTSKRPEEMKDKVALLLRHGANVNLMNLSRKTPLMVAAGLRWKHDNVLKLLLEYQPELDVRDQHGNTALHFAVKNGVLDKLEMLARKGANLNIANHVSRTPLMVAFNLLHLEFSDEWVVFTLLGHGAVINEHKTVTVRWMWESDFVYNLKQVYKRDLEYKRTILSCTGALFHDRRTLCGTNLSNLDLLLLILIKENEVKLLSLLVKRYVRPHLIHLLFHRDVFPFCEMLALDAALVNNSRVSLMCIAVLLRKPEVIALLAQTCFFHQQDVKLLQHSAITEKLRQIIVDQPSTKITDSCSLDDVCPEKWSLRTWSKLAVLRAVGYCEGREKRVRNLPIPRLMQDELLNENSIS